MKYNGTIYRPPVEADTFLLPVTEGCTHNKCRFCSMYKDIPFRMINLPDIELYLKEAAGYYHAGGQSLKRIYLVGADPFALSACKIKVVINIIHKYLPECETITMYAAVRNIMTKTEEELECLKKLGVDDLYVGVESGLEQVLSYLNKGNTVADAKQQLERLNSAGIKHMDMLMLGAAGQGRAKESAMAAAQLLNAVKPKMILVNTMSIFPETNLYREVEAGKFVPAKEKEILTEEKMLIENLQLPDTFFWAAHALDSVPLADKLKNGKRYMLKILEQRIVTMDENKFEQTFQRTLRHI